MTSHLESCKAHAEERMKQLRVVMQRMKEAPDDVTVLFGGDTNLRDPEASRPSSPKVLVGDQVRSVTSLCPRPRWPRWVCRPVCVTYGSDSESRNTVATRGTPKPTATRLFVMWAAAVLTGFTSAQRPRTASLAWRLITWPLWVLRSWTVDATPVTTGESIVASLLLRKASDKVLYFISFNSIFCSC